MAALGKVSGSIAKCAGAPEAPSLRKTSPGRGTMSPEGDKKGNGWRTKCDGRSDLVRTPSVIACGNATSLMEEGFSGGWKASGPIARCAASPEALPLGELARKRLRGRGRCPQRCAFAESGAANAVFRHDSSRENGIPERPQTLRYAEIIKFFPLNMARAQAEAILNRPLKKET